MKDLTRRSFLHYSLAAAALGVTGMPQLAFAQATQGTGKTLVLINLQGGIDGLSIAVPYTNSVYYGRRPETAIPQGQVLPLTAEVGLHPELALLLPFYQEQRLAVVQQVGYPDPSLSHSESEAIWSFGKRRIGNETRGWIGRLADQYFDSLYDVFGIGVPQRADFVVNRAEVRPSLVTTLRDFGPGWDWSSGNDGSFRRTVGMLNSFSPGLPRPGIKSSLRSIHTMAEQLDEIDNDYQSSVNYPGGTLAWNLREAAKLIQANIGTQMIYTATDGWDTHARQRERMRDPLRLTAQALDAFVRDLKNMGKWGQVCVVLFSEFGRACGENGSEGTDHGHGNVMMLLGGGVRGGVYGPTPSGQDLQRQYLDCAVDFRSVLKTIIAAHLGLDPGPVLTEPIPAHDVALPLFT